MRIFFAATVLLASVLNVPLHARAQASAIPSANAGAESSATTEARGRALLTQMVTALGGDAWLHRSYWTAEGKGGIFYKGLPSEGMVQFEEFHRAAPFGVRIEIITKMGVFIPTAKRDIAQVWTPDTGYEVTYRGSKELPAEIVADNLRWRAHSLDTVVRQWLPQPGTAVVYEGTTQVERRIADRVSVLSANNDTVTLELDATTHLPLDLAFETRNETYHDHDAYREEYADYQPIGGTMTPLTLTRYKNGDMIAERFYSKITYVPTLDAALFDPKILLVKKK
jgi:hypothetical protein